MESRELSLAGTVAALAAAALLLGCETKVPPKTPMHQSAGPALFVKYPWLADRSAPKTMAAKSTVKDLPELLTDIAENARSHGLYRVGEINYYPDGDPTPESKDVRHIAIDISVQNDAMRLDVYLDQGAPRTLSDAKAAGLKPLEVLEIRGRDWRLSKDGRLIDHGRLSQR